jgi:hypothetical protein
VAAVFHDLVAADVRRLKHCFGDYKWSLLTSAATVLEFKARIGIRRILSRRGVNKDEDETGKHAFPAIH